MISGIKNEQGKITHYMAIKEDITEKKRVQDELKKAKEKAEESDRLKSSFLANMSHEIRTPLNAILGFTSLLKDYKLDIEKSTKFLNLIQINGKQLLSIIDDVLLISKLQVGKIKVSHTEFSLNDFMNKLFESFNKEVTLETDKLNLIIDIPKTEILVKSDQIKLNQIFSKLIRNAIKFTSEGQITIGYKLKNNQPEFFVKDTGIGISEKKQQIIFQKFRQIDDSKTRKYGGTGLGLSIAKSLIDLLNGTIWLDSKEGKGSNFYFKIPFEVKTAVKNTKKQNTYKWNNKTMLIVDDVPESILLIKEIVRDTGIQTLTANNGIESIEKVKSNANIDIILMDIQLPKLNGIEAAKRILALKNIPIIIQSAYSQIEYHEECKKIACSEFIQKPINPTELLNKIKNFI